MNAIAILGFLQISVVHVTQTQESVFQNCLEPIIRRSNENGLIVHVDGPRTMADLVVRLLSQILVLESTVSEDAVWYAILLLAR